MASNGRADNRMKGPGWERQTKPIASAPGGGWERQIKPIKPPKQPTLGKPSAPRSDGLVARPLFAR